MKNLILKISLKYGIIFGGFSFIYKILSLIMFPPVPESIAKVPFVIPYWYWVYPLFFIIVCSFIALSTYDDRATTNLSFNKSIIIIIMFVLLIIIIESILNIIIHGVWFICLITAMAHYEFNKKNMNYISFKNAIIIGLIIIAFFTLEKIYDLVYKGFIIKLEYGEEYWYKKTDFSINRLIFNHVGKLLREVCILFMLITVESYWKIFKKAGKKGWTSIIPIYNTILLLDIVKRPRWKVVFLFIPVLNIIYAIKITNLISKRFNKNKGFTLGLLFLPFIFYPLLGMSIINYLAAELRGIKTT
ncbi:MAG: hypothetical protein JW702_08260 [Clostridiales bacterium]|nr:hypothetical protein [Clostridiales bacterium]